MEQTASEGDVQADHQGGTGGSFSLPGPTHPFTSSVLRGVGECVYARAHVSDPL